MVKALVWMTMQQRKLSAFILGSGLLLGALWVPCTDARYDAFSLAVAGLAGALIAGHAFQTWKGPKPPAPNDSGSAKAE